ncbi:MAG TPA: hypothetical protein VHD58_03770 [Mycobacteriales bacterium]|nr:hypothetical protein [Mycobacteriales bacterium]HVU60757.1 hypothetical protein [Mycobacteriales bacterium]
MFGLGKGGKLPAKATIVANEGYGMAQNSMSVALQHQKYIVDVHPDNGDPAFRTELKVWVSWPDHPDVGDVVSALYKPGSNKAEIVLEGDPRFDWKLRKATKDAGDAATREALLNAPPDTLPPLPPK